MEFLEYYRVIKERIWLVLVTTGVILLMVIIYQLMPESSYQATGSLRVKEGANQIAVQQADTVTIASTRTFWETFIQIGESRELVREAAARIGITGPDIVKRLQSFDLDQPTRGDTVNFTAVADGSEKAVNLARAGMEALIEYWRQIRISQAQQIRENLQEPLAEAESELAAAEQELKKFESTDLPGTPQDQMMAVQQELIAIQSELASARVELSLAQDRATAVRQLARQEAAKPVSERTMTASPEVTALQTQRQALETQLAALLRKKKPEHPDVQALQAQIEEIDKKLKEQPRGGEGEETIAGPFRDQIMTAELDARAAQGRITALEARLRELSSRMPALREQVKTYQEVTQRADQARALRDRLKGELMTLDAEMTRLRQSEDIEILDPPVLQPSSKTIRKFLLLFVAGTFMGIVLGSMLALLLRYVDITVKNELDVAQMLGKRTLAVIPRFEEVVAVEAEEAEPPPPEEGGEAEPIA